jgi:hypothetical protein
MTWKLATGLSVWLVLPALLAAAEPSWEGKTVILARPGVKLEPPESKDSAVKKSGVAKDLTFSVRKEAQDTLLIESRRGLQGGLRGQTGRPAVRD